MIPTPTLKRRVINMFAPLVWRLLVWSARTWTNNYLDQWEKFRFKCAFGHDTFVTISFYDPYPDSFDDLDNQPLPPDIDRMAPS